MLEENLTPLYVRKKIYHQKLGEKSSLIPEPNHTYPPPKVKSATFLEVKVKAFFFGRYFTCKTMQVSLALALLACVASVSSRGSSRKLGQEQKK